MANLKFNVVPNPLYDEEKGNGRYIGQLVLNGSMTLDAFCDQVAARRSRTNIDSETVKLVIKTLYAVLREEIVENNYTCSLDSLSFRSAISGSLEAADSALSAENQPYVGVYPSYDLANEMAALSATRETTTETVAALHQVEDLATHDKNVVHGSDTAVLTGRNISATQTGENVKLVQAETGVTASTATIVAEEGYGQRIKVNFPGPFDAGAYYVVLTTRGHLTPEGELNVLRQKVQALAAAAPAPTLTDVRSDGQTADTVKVNDQITLTGTRLGDYDLAAGDSITVRYKYNGEERYFDASRLVEDPSATTLKPEARLTSSCDDGTIGTVEVKIGSDTVTHAFTVLNLA